MSDWGLTYGPWKLPDWARGMEIRRSITTERLTAVNDAIERSRPQPGNGIAVTPRGWYVDNFDSMPDTVASSPFGVSIFPNPANTALRLASVFWDSSLLKNLILNNTQSITGLSTLTSAYGFNFDYGHDLIWLEGILDGSGKVTSAYINSWGMTSPPALNTWAPGDLPGEYGSGHGPFEYQLTYDGGGNKIFTQYLFRIAIFASVTSTTAPYPVSNIQLLNSNLLMRGDLYTGALYTTADGPASIGIVMPQPYAGPYVST